MVKRADDDLFAETTMSFGEHLEELRVAVLKAMVGLVLGFLLGLAVAKYVVAYIQTPLKSALEEYYIKKTISDLQTEYAATGDVVSHELEAFIRDKRLVFEKVYVEADEVARVTALAAGKQKKPGAAKVPAAGTGTGIETPVPPPADPLTIVDDRMPPPKASLITTRTWRPIQTVVRALNAQEAFMIWLKASFVSGLVIAGPYMLWQLWLFVAAGLYPHEKRYVHIYLPMSVGLFLSGAATAFFVAFKYVLEFLFSFNASMQIDPDPRISEWLSFVLLLPLGFGVAFQLPLVMLFLHRIGIFSLQAYLEKWRVAILVIFVASMILTPTADPITMMLMAGPLTLLYFFGILLCKWMPRNKSPFSESYEP